MFISDIAHQIIERIAGPPNTPKWRVVTGLTGWAGAITFAVYLLISLFGFPGATWIGGAAAFLIVSATKLLRAGGRY
jgi:hypothetical protein